MDEIVEHDPEAHQGEESDAYPLVDRLSKVEAEEGLPLHAAKYSI